MIVGNVDSRLHRRFACDDPVCRIRIEVDRGSCDRADRLRLVEIDIESHDVGIAEHRRDGEVQADVAVFNGADGVLICGCHPGDCHYTSGNLKMETRFTLLKSLLEEAGIEPERVHLQWASAAEGDVFTEGVTKMVERIKMIGPNPARKGD